MSESFESEQNGILRLNNRLEAYETFFDGRWAKRLQDLTNDTRLSQIAFDLCVDWKSAANTFRLPWLMMYSLGAFMNAFMQTNEPFWQKLTKALADYLLKGVGTTLSNMKRKEMISIVNKVSQRVQNEIEKNPPPFRIEYVWDQYIDNPEFGMSIWGSQRLCYGALYYAYENFMRRCIEIAKGVSHYQGKTKEMQSYISEFIGKGLGDHCLGEAEIEIARLVRHSLVHNGGRVTPALRKKKHGLTVQNDVIQIMPDDTRLLFNQLKGRVITLVERALTLPQFKTQANRP